MARPSVFVGGLLLLVGSLAGLRCATELARANDPYRHHDFRTLRQHQELFYRGFYPHAAVETPPPHERYANSVYPPYAFITAIPWLPPGRGNRWGEVWFTGCQLAAMAALLAFAWQQGREVDPWLGWLLVGSVVAMTGWWADFLFGNFSALACAPLVALFAWERRARSGVSGAFWWAAMLKPQVGLFFFTLLLRRARWSAATLGLALILLASLLACRWTGVALTDAVSAVYLRGIWELSGDGNSLVTIARLAGIPGSIAQPVLAVLGLFCLVAALRTRLLAAETLKRFAMVAVLARLCLYHRPCDDVMLIFTLAHLARQAWSSLLATDWLLAIALGFTVWCPTRWTEFPLIKIAIMGVWVVVALNLIRKNGPLTCAAKP